MDEHEYKKIKHTAKTVQQNSDILLVIGIGGSYLGAKAAIEMIHHSFRHLLDHEQNKPEVIFVGNQMSATYINDLIDEIKNNYVSINVISNSGKSTTLDIA